MKIDLNEISSMQYALSKVDVSIPIKKYPASEYTKEDVKEILGIMRKQLEWVARHPNEDDPYGTKGKDWKDEYQILTGLADHYGVEI